MSLEVDFLGDTVLTQPIDQGTAVTVARDMLRRKGYDAPLPEVVTKIDDLPVWYVQFRLPSTVVEIEVEYVKGTGWVRTVSAVEDL